MASPLTLARIFGPHWTGEHLTNSDARKLLQDLKAWAEQFEHQDANTLTGALDDLEMLFLFAWNEIDTSLSRLSLIRPSSADDQEHLAVAMHYLHRWQDRGDHIKVI
jgi:hypothetical protein